MPINNFSDNVFIIDPIDGTTNFVHNFPFCAISIAFYSDKKSMVWFLILY